MIAFSTSLPRAGSAWYQALTRDVLIANGRGALSGIVERHALHDVILSSNGRLINLTAPTLRRLHALHEAGHTIVVKTHKPPTTPWHALLGETGIARVTHIYRDPRDVALSALEFGARTRGQGRFETTLARIKNSGDMLTLVRYTWLPSSARWQQVPGILPVRYEDILADPHHAIRALDKHLGFSTSGAVLNAIVAHNSAATVRESSDRVRQFHLNEARVGRHREVMNRAEQERFLDTLGPWLEAQGYCTTLTAEEGPGLDGHIARIEAQTRGGPGALRLLRAS